MIRAFGESQPTLDYHQIIRLIVPKHGNLVLLCVFLHRAKNICSTSELYLQEVNKLRVIFQMNGYPNLFINDTIRKFEELNANTKDKEKREKAFFIYSWFTIFWKNFSSIFQTA